MPIYEYECQFCGHRFERLQHFSDEPLKMCPDCGGVLQRVIQPVGIVFKGSGFYITDNRQLASKETAKELSGADSGEAKGEEKTKARKKEQG